MKVNEVSISTFSLHILLSVLHRNHVLFATPLNTHILFYDSTYKRILYDHGRRAAANLLSNLDRLKYQAGFVGTQDLMIKKDSVIVPQYYTV